MKSKLYTAKELDALLRGKFTRQTRRNAMLNNYERHLIFSYLSNATSHFRHYHTEAKELAQWVAENRDVLAINDVTEELGERRLHHEKGLPEQDWRLFTKAIEETRSASRHVRGDRTALRLRRLGKEMHLTRTDVAVLESLLRYRTQPIIESLVDNVFGHGGSRWNSKFFNVKSSALSCLLGVSAGMVLARFAPDASLVKSGLVAIEDDGDVRLIDRLRRLDSVPGDVDVHRLLLDVASPSELDWSDFDHVTEDRDDVESILKGALQTGALGVNVLVYGPPGTGKTEFCKTLSARLGVKLYSVGESDEHGGEPSRNERLQELRLIQRLLAPGHGSILLFDEMEDLLADQGAGQMLKLFGLPGPRGQGSKVFMHRLLEQTPVPTLWTVNDARAIPQTILRRMMFAVELRQPSVQVRERIWMRQLVHHGIESGAEDARALAREFDVTPGVASGAIAAARLSGGGLTAVRRGVRSLARVLSAEKPPQGTPEKFDPALIRANGDPVRFAERLVESGQRRFSLCLQGPPGTGKSAYVRYLAERLGLEVVQKRASDLMSYWVGETERRIAEAFAEARDAGYFLVFDEADSLLADRRFAVRTWEVSQVNEMLTWMETHPLPFACTTNFGEHLDVATLRRFIFKIELDYLTPEKATAAFRTYFALTPPAEVATLTTLTPGDFAVVRRKAEILNLLQAPKELTAMLRAECEAKLKRRERQ